MIIRVLSDLHLEFLGDYKSLIFSRRDWNSYTVIPKMENERDQVLVLAGDIVMVKFIDRFYPFFRDISDRFKEVVVCTGNHESYRHNFLKTHRDYKNFLTQFHNIHLLEKESIIIDDIAFFGGTMWTNFKKRNPNDMLAAKNGMSDFHVIEYSPEDHSAYGLFSPELSVLEHEKTLEEMVKFFKQHKKLKRVIVTHHAPSFKSTSMQYWNSTLNAAFSSDLDTFVAQHSPELWIHGHHHSSSDYMIASTRVVCNPGGYDNNTENSEFDSQLTISI